jgi:hypothetical protein
MMLAFGTHQTTKKREKLVSPSDPREWKRKWKRNSMLLVSRRKSMVIREYMNWRCLSFSFFLLFWSKHFSFIFYSKSFFFQS